MKHVTRKATRHVNQNEGLIFEKSSPGKAAWKLPPLDVPEVDTGKLLGASERKDLGNMPEVSEIEIIRHFTRLSTWNYAIDLGMYPLGSWLLRGWDAASGSSLAGAAALTFAASSGTVGSVPGSRRSAPSSRQTISCSASDYSTPAACAATGPTRRSRR